MELRLLSGDSRMPSPRKDALTGGSVICFPKASFTIYMDSSITQQTAHAATASMAAPCACGTARQSRSYRTCHDYDRPYHAWIPCVYYAPAPPTAGLNKYSSRITQPKSQGASQAMLYATGEILVTLWVAYLLLWGSLGPLPPTETGYVEPGSCAHTSACSSSVQPAGTC